MLSHPPHGSAAGAAPLREQTRVPRGTAPTRPPLPFPELMSRLLHKYQLALPEGPAQEVYMLHFAAEPSVQVVSRTGAQCIDVVTTAAELTDMKTAELLAALLDLNTMDQPNFNTVIMLDRATRAVIVKARLPQAVVDVTTLERMVQGVRLQAGAVRKLMHGTSTPDTAP